MSNEIRSEEGWYYQRPALIGFWVTFSALVAFEAFLMGNCLCETNCRDFYIDGHWGVATSIRQALFADLHDFVIMFLGILIAYLTVMQLWTLPVSKYTGGAVHVTPAGSASRESGDSPLQSNLAKTVIAGLSGLFAISALKPLISAERTAESLIQYLFWYVFALFAILVWAARRSAQIEQQRVEITMRRRAALGLGETKAQIKRFAELVYHDTFNGFIQGRKQQATEVLVQRLHQTEVASHTLILAAIADLQRSIYAVIVQALGPSSDPSPRIRVSMTLLADNGRTAFYLTSHPRSLRVEFAERSIASLCLRTRLVRWIDVRWVGADAAEGLVLVSPKEIPTEMLGDGEGQFPATEAFLLKDWYQSRTGGDYEAFIVFPTYLHRNPGRRAAAIHISFAAAGEMHRVFPETRDERDQKVTSRIFEQSRQILFDVGEEGDARGRTQKEVRIALQQALLLLETLVPGVQDVLLQSRGEGTLTVEGA